MARAFGLRHREAHVGEQAAVAPFPNVSFGLRVRLGACDADRVEPELLAVPANIADVHARIMPA